MFDKLKCKCLIDSGATNNFISSENCKKLGLILSECDSINVRLADGKTINTTAYTTA